MSSVWKQCNYCLTWKFALIQSGFYPFRSNSGSPHIFMNSYEEDNFFFKVKSRFFCPSHKDAEVYMIYNTCLHFQHQKNWSEDGLESAILSYAIADWMTSLEDICRSQSSYLYHEDTTILYCSTSILQRTFLVYHHVLTIIVPCHPFAQAPNQILDTNAVLCQRQHDPTHTTDYQPWSTPKTPETTFLLPDKRASCYYIIRL